MPTVDRVIPLLVYENLPTAHDFLVDAFGFEPGGVHYDDDGSPLHAEVRAGHTTIWMHRVVAEQRLNTPRVVESVSGLVVFVDDVDAHYARAVAAGASVDSEPRDQPYGEREYGARDLEGHRWWFVMPIVAPVA